VNYEWSKSPKSKVTRLAKALVDLVALNMQPTDERPARLGSVVVGPVSGCVVDCVALDGRSVRPFLMRRTLLEMSLQSWSDVGGMHLK